MGYIHNGQYVTPSSNPALHQQLAAEDAARYGYGMSLFQGSLAGSSEASSVTPGFGAIAYSPLARRCGYSWAGIDRVVAEKRALEECGAEDALVVTWGENSWLALARGPGREWGAAGGDTRTGAEEGALAACRNVAADPRLLISFSTAEGLARAFGAIAYSPLTGNYGYSWAATDRVVAEKRALEECGAEDALVVAWGENRWLALARGPGREWGAAWEATRTDAKEGALAACRNVSADPRLLISFSTAQGQPVRGAS